MTSGVPLGEGESRIELHSGEPYSTEHQPGGVVSKRDHAMPVTWGIVLAAGSSTRMGRQKLTLPLKDGVPMIRHVLSTATASRLDKVIVVVNAADENVLRATRSGAGDRWSQVENYEAADGMSTSLRAGIRVAAAKGADAALILLGDQPGITTRHINTIVQSYRASRAPIVQAAYDGTPGHPILFDKRLFSGLLQVSGDQGGREVVQAYKSERQLVLFAGDVPVDLDTPTDYETWIRENP